MTFDLFTEMFAVEFHMVVNLDAAQRNYDSAKARRDALRGELNTTTRP